MTESEAFEIARKVLFSWEALSPRHLVPVGRGQLLEAIALTLFEQSNRHQLVAESFQQVSRDLKSELIAHPSV